MIKHTISFIVPTLNEEQNIKDTFDTIKKNVPHDKLNYEIILVDGGSTDRTVEISKSLAESDEKIRIYSDKHIKGLGHAFKKGVSLAKGDYIILFPGDNEVTGDAVQTILKEAGSTDMVIPYFVNQEIRSSMRRVISRLFVRILNWISGMNLKYYNGTVLYRRETLKSHNIRTTGFAFQAEILVSLIGTGLTFKEVETKIQLRGEGKTKIFKLKNIASVTAFLVKLFWQQKIRRSSFYKKPLIKQIDKLITRRGLPELHVPDRINYIAAFLTFNCNMKCDYCINNYEAQILKKGVMGGDKWVWGLNRLNLHHNLPVTLQGGEPTLHRDFYYIIDNLKPEIEIDILTNLQFDIDEFINRVNPKRINRDPRFHSIRASYHPDFSDMNSIIEKVVKLQNAGFNICVSAVSYPENKEDIARAEAKAREVGITFFIKEFLGYYNGKSYGSYKYPEAVTSKYKKDVLCRISELLIGPLGDIHKCTRDTYMNGVAIGNLLDQNFKIEHEFRNCHNYGYCNPCDIKIKTDRFLNYGHTSAEIKIIDQ